MTISYPIKIAVSCLIFLMALFFTGAVDLSLSLGLSAGFLLFNIPAGISFLLSFIFFFMYLVLTFLNLKLPYVFDLSVSSYILFAASVILYFLQGQKSHWKITLPDKRTINFSGKEIFRLGAVLVFSALIFPLVGAHTAGVLGYILFLMLFRKITEGRYAFGLALTFLVFCPFLLIGRKEKIAENSAIFTYYFLVLGTLQEIIDMVRNPQDYKEEEEEGKEPEEEMKQPEIRSHRVQLVDESYKEYVKKMKIGQNFRHVFTVFIAGLLSLVASFFLVLYALTYLSQKNINLKISGPEIEKKERKIVVVPTVLPSDTPTPTKSIDELKISLSQKLTSYKIQILNGTEIPGLASSASGILKNAGFKNIDIGNADESTYQNWEISYKEKDDDMNDYLKRTFELSDLTSKEASSTAKYDIGIVIGVNK